MGFRVAPFVALAVALWLCACLSDDALRVECSGDVACADGARCEQGLCVTDVVLQQVRCEAGETLCGDDCVNLVQSSRHCGACGVACEAAGPGIEAFCVEGACVVTCAEGFFDLDGEPGCEAACTPEQRAAREACDGVDNDCDGLVDEGDDDYREPCALRDGVCAPAQARCDGGVPVACDALDYLEAASAPFEADRETRCDGADNNCDGAVDEHCCAGPTSAATLGTGIVGVLDTDDGAAALTLLDDARDRRWSLPAWSPATLLNDRAAPVCDRGLLVDAFDAGASRVLRCRDAEGDRLVHARTGELLALARRGAVVTGAAAAGARAVLTWRESTGAATQDRWVAWTDDAPGDAHAGAWPQPLTQPLLPAAHDGLALLVADPVAPAIAAHPLSAGGDVDGRRIGLVDDAAGLVAGAPLAVAAPRAGWFAFAAGAEGRSVYLRALGATWSDAAPPAIALGDAAGTIASLHLLPVLPSAADTPAVAAASAGALDMWQLGEDGTVTHRRVPLPGAEWRAAMDGAVLLLVARPDTDTPWQLTRHGRDGGRLCP